MSGETFGFTRMRFPARFRGHTLLLLDNKGEFTVDGRLAFHITLYCSRCDDEVVVRGRLPPDQSSEQKMAIVKLAALGGFKEECPNVNRNTYNTVAHTPL